jgi:hypothetical protein
LVPYARRAPAPVNLGVRPCIALWTNMDRLRLRLMHREAIRRLSDAQLLVEADPLGSRRADSNHLLELIGLELLLKFLFEIEHSRQADGFGHDYKAIFSVLQPETQARLISLCGERIGPSAFTAEPTKILAEWGRNFVGLRYPFERYKGLSEEQYASTSARWLQKGAKLESATFRFYPQELSGVLYALQTIANEHALRIFGEEFIHDIF